MTDIAPAVRDLVASEIAATGGREVSFVADVDAAGTITYASAVARGTAAAVLALPGVAARGQMVLHNHPSGLLEPSQADLEVAARLHFDGIGFGIINNDASQLSVVVEVPRAKSYAQLDPVATADLLAVDGPVAGVLGQFENRRSQRDMASFVSDTYNEGGVSLLESGTGVGKSFAYLVPAIRWAQMNDGERTVVSTNTINLQEQLVGKDLPLLARAFGDDEAEPTFALLKGWSNYICLNRLQVAQGGQASLLEPDRQGELEVLADWAAHTGDGSLADLPDVPSPEVWDEVCAEADLCTRQECPYYDRCFVINAHVSAAAADVVVVNHHLLTADLAVRRVQNNWLEKAVLPFYRRLIIDEAHHLEDVAAKHLGAQVTSRGLGRLLSRLERGGRGLIPTLVAELRGRDDQASRASLDLLRKTLLPEVGDARTYADRVFAILCERLASSDDEVQRLDDSFAADEIWEQGLDVAVDNLVRVLARLAEGVEAIVDRMQLDEDPDRRSQLVQELRGVVRRFQSMTDAILLALRPQSDAQLVRWLDRRGNRPAGNLPFHIGLAAVPLDLAPVLRESLFDRIDTVVLTSATLATGGDFSFLKERLGLDRAPDPIKHEESLPSPFDFSRQCLFGVPTDFPDPRSDEEGHGNALAEALLDLAHAADGGMFVLFTSYAALRRAAVAVKGSIGGRWPVLVQGEGQRDHLLRRFREAGSAILFGTDSFWEGVDVPGRSLRVLVLAKLPFKVPSEPLTAARLEALAGRGVDGFSHYLLPHAALKLKQGFGRLIRSSSDVGVVMLMDPRVTRRNYGNLLLASLPPATRSIGPWSELRSTAEEFFAQHGIGAPV
ncbi:MAG: helicase [Gemmatimonadota bacterium]|nr:MAG: helicase [Gemmatimonadota bacterium]